MRPFGLLLCTLLGFATAGPVYKRTWGLRDGDGNLDMTGPESYGNKEFQFLVDLKNFKAAVIANAGGVNGPGYQAWMDRIPNVLPTYGATNPAYVPYVAGDLAGDGFVVRQGALWTSKMGGNGLQKDMRVTGKYNGVGVNAAGRGYTSVKGSVMAGTEYKIVAAELARGFNTIPTGQTSTVLELLSDYVNGEGRGDLATTLDSFTDATYDINVQRVALGRFPMQQDGDGRLVFDAAATTDSQVDRRDVATHAAILKTWIVLGRTLQQTRPSTQRDYNPYSGCGHLTKRADSGCVQDFEIINDDTLGEVETPDEVVKQSQTVTLLFVKALTGDPKILRNYNGEGTSSDPDDGTELSPDEMYEGATTQDEADIAIEDALTSLLNGDSDVDKGLFAKFVGLFRRDIRMRVANLKARAAVLGINFGKDVNAEAKANALQRLVQLYKDTYGRFPEQDDPDVSQDDLDLETLDTSVPFSDYRGTETIKSVNEVDALNIAAELFPELVTTSENVATTEEGDEQVIDTTHMVEGSVEYAKVWGRLAPAIKALLKTPNLPKWKYDRVKAILSKIGKSLEARNKDISDKAKSGLEIGNLEINDRNAIEAFHQDVYKEAVGMDTEGMDNTEVVPTPEWVEVPEFITETPTSTIRTARTGNPILYRSKPVAKLDLNRKPKTPTKSQRLTQRNPSSGGMRRRRR